VGDVPYKLKDYLVNTNLLFNFVKTNTHMTLRANKRLAYLLEIMLKDNSSRELVSLSYNITIKINKVRYSKVANKFKVDLIVTNINKKCFIRDPNTYWRIKDERGEYKYEYKSFTPDRSSVFRINKHIRYRLFNSVCEAGNMFSIDSDRIILDKITYCSSYLNKNVDMENILKS
jgi:hypothetical protein